MSFFVVAAHQSIISFLLHSLEHLFIVGQSSLLDDLAHLSLDAATDHSVNGVLLALNYFASVQLLLVGVDFGVEGELLY